jgi:P27 family predicted phage terminase small subunit
MTAPTPIEQKRLSNPGKRRIIEPNIQLSRAKKIPDMPPGLYAEGEKAWTRIWRLGREWVAPDSDVALVVRLCKAYDTEQELRDVVLREGSVIDGAKGARLVHPAVRELRQLGDSILRLEAALGLGPAARARTAIAAIEVYERGNKLDRYLNEG